MSQVDFPNSPTNGQLFQSNGIGYIYLDGTWVRKSPADEPLSVFSMNAKGSMVSASASSAPVEVLLSSNGLGLRANSSTTAGLEWASMPASTVFSLDELGDVVDTSPSVGAVLRWNGSNWVSSTSLFSGAFSISAVTTGRAIAASDVGALISADSASTLTITVPPNSSVPIETGRFITILQAGSGQVQLSAGLGVTINGRTKLRAQYSAATLLKRGADSWVFMGDTVD